MFQPVTTETPWRHDGDTMVPSGERNDFPDTAFPMDENTERAIMIALLFTGWAVMVVIRHLLIPAAAALVATVWPRRRTAPVIPSGMIRVTAGAHLRAGEPVVIETESDGKPVAIPLQPRTRKRRGSA